jgi:hypothetical protein
MSKKLRLVSLVVALVGVLVIAGCGSPKELTVYNGSGQTSVFRVGPGKDANGGQIYSLTTEIGSASCRERV